MARKKEKKCVQDGAGFLTTYADIVTLLMAFFVLLFAISSIEESKFLSLLQGLEGSFGNSSYQDRVLLGGPSIIGANQPGGSSFPVESGVISIVPNQDVADLTELQGAAFVDNSADGASGLPRVDGDDTGEGGANSELPELANILDLSELREVKESLIEAAREAGLADSVTAEIRARGLVVVLSADDILFRSGRADIEPGIGLEFIGTIASVVGDIDNPIHIEGHTDDVPLGNPAYSNWNLSADRAIAVLNVLLNEYGIDGNRLRAVANADQYPLVPNDSDENRSRNRRVEIVIGIDDDDTELLIQDPALSAPLA
ncbi:MAG: flagellar motor protein MotB [Actinobacteria bacterium]|nr:flagellar motor protein MotB [Actinomycetota bacterium]